MRAGLVLLLCISIACISLNVFATSDYRLLTVEGNLTIRGNEPGSINILTTVDGESFSLRKGVTEEILTIRQYDLLITGKVNDKNMTPIQYNTTFEKNVDEAEDALIIGELFYTGKDLFLLTDDQYVIKVKSGLDSELQGQKLLVRGYYNKTGKYQASLSVRDFIRIK